MTTLRPGIAIEPLQQRQRGKLPDLFETDSKQIAAFRCTYIALYR
jgi:hypothetical protein